MGLSGLFPYKIQRKAIRRLYNQLIAFLVEKGCFITAPFIVFMLCNYLELANTTMPIKMPKTIIGIKLVIIEMPKVAIRDLLIW